MSKESEWKTRQQRINTKLRSLNPKWEIIKYRDGLDTSALQCHAVEEYPTASGPADYALFVKGRFLGVIEAKKVSVGAQNVLEQAKRYSRTAFDGTGNWRGYRVPFLYSTNGEIIYFLDVGGEQNIFRKIANFHTADALTELFEHDQAASYTRLQNTPIELIKRLRPYQENAIAATEDALVKGKRAMLVAMATGTGKTFLTVAQIYRLLESKVAKRILFLVDRRALAAQAVRTFASFNTPRGNKFNQEYEVYSQRFRREDFGEEEAFDPQVLPSSYLTAPQSTHTFVYVSTIQRMTINLFGKASVEVSEDGDIDDESDAEELSIPIHAFDLIIADECHRGYTAKETSAWRNTLDYFDAIKIGLTATPAVNTLSLFKEVVYRYSTEEAIADGYLVDYESVYIYSNVRMNGAFLREGEQVGVVDTETGEEIYDELEDEREFSTTDIEHKITVPDSNRKIIEDIAKYADRHEEETGRFPRILIFAVNDLPHRSHADQIVGICKEVFGRGDDFVQKITGSPSVDRPLQKIREFRNRPQPKVAVTVDMLSTGVDIPSLEFVVFMRPVKSRILWVQMLGRGTRLCDEINKTHFKIFDCLGGSLIEYFANTIDLKIEPPRKDLVPVGQVIKKIYQNLDRDYNLKSLVKRLRRIDRGMSDEARERFADYIPDGDMGRFAGELTERIERDFTNTLNLLQDHGFQDLLENYPRAKQNFLVAYEQEDTVSSEVMIRGQKPEDYLDSFCRFVRENSEQIEAIAILLERPRDWKTQALNELREKLGQNQFREQELQRATQLVHSKALADIISMVKRAAYAEEPIYTAAERIERAIASVMVGKSFNDEQLKWLGYIQEHLVQNLTLDIDDFEYAPIFERFGGKGKAKKVFSGGLESLIDEINAAIAA
ncbi:DEAD/DEAH box helicase family protein [Trichocoleus sp. DQ-A3]|uniref:type I restriction endonuclease subunit R n=1 Tax=Cyanophyceae TaxID=3028117 RepID=UPI001683F102|nr:type I restriction-modification enzyme R subunit C-terminal domain-containing protein [Coleofasciculus sp. FACHB-125]MBD1902694.1 DEAD/DEAH box helicase family protein [Coleofasciculus sp. FACHB-125]